MTIVLPRDRQHWLELRAGVVTSTEVSALFGESPYLTAFELWHRKKSGDLGEIADNDRMKWGRRLEASIAEGVAEDFGVDVRNLQEFATHDDVRMGASFDYEIIGTLAHEPLTGDRRLVDLYDEFGPGVMEIKNVDGLAWRNNWTRGEVAEAPAHIEIQLQAQLDCLCREWGCIVALVGGNEAHVIIRKRDPAVGNALRRKVAEFWASIEANNPPPPVMPQDAAFIVQLYQFAEPGKLFDGRGDAEIASLCAEYHQAGKDEKAAKDRKESARARLLERIGDAEKVMADGFTVSAGMVGPAEIPAYTRAGYRSFRLTAKKTTSKE